MAMANSTGLDHHYNDYWSQPRGFLTPPPTWKTNRSSPATTRSEKKTKTDLFHVIHKIPSGDSPYVRAKHVQLVDKDPSRAVSLFWAAINSGDRVDSALKDMAVVMKQLDRSDEAIEAIKSFRHLSSPESQESLDNILVELYKQSGRIEEEIEMLRRKLKQVEEGVAFSGKRTKIARCQGKKIQITVEKEYSRLLGNLAWAYMQQKDFKSAEEHYRKALSLEPDKNKKCNLAICLMHMNKLTEAKFLLQTIRSSSGNGNVDESYGKSYERASEMLAEFESQKQTGHNETKLPFGGQWEGEVCSQKNFDDNNSMQSSPQPLSVKTNNGSFTGFAYEKRADFDWRRNHYVTDIGQEEAYYAGCNRNIPKVPFAQPRRCSRTGGDQRKGGLMKNEYGSYCRKLSFGSSTCSDQSFVSQSVNYCSTALPGEMPLFSDWRRNSSDVMPSERKMTSLEYDCLKSAIVESDLPKKSWADMVEEDEMENVESCDEAEKVSRKMELIDIGKGGCYRSQPVRRSLCFDQNHNPNMPIESLNFEDDQIENFSCVNNRRRLQVFQDITSPISISL